MMQARFAMGALLGLVGVASACGGDQPDQVVVAGVTYTPDGALAILTNDGIFLIDPQLDDTPKAHLALRGLQAFQQFNLYQYSLSADGTVTAVAYSPDTSAAPISLGLYRVPTGEVLNSFKVARPANGDRASEMLALALSPHGDLVAAVWLTGGEEVDLAMIEAATGAVIWKASNVDRTLVGWSPDGATLYALGQTTTGSILEAYDARTGLRWSQQYPYVVTRLAVAAGGATLAGVANPLPCTAPCPIQYSLWSAVDGTLLAQQPFAPGETPASGPYGGLGDSVFTCSATSNICAIELSDSSIPPYTYSVRVYRTDGTDISTLPLQEGFASSIALSPDGQFVTTGTGTPTWASGYNDADVYRISDGTRVVSYSFDRPCGNCSGPSGRRVVLGSKIRRAP